ncbi:MAG: hypothetical protein HYS32_00385 [Candidatus Woesearchaeota archaeon]|nr:MAG: hypothetical protein HYS32_00385 [Candidatus Woesearchaeota archaeon]
MKKRWFIAGLMLILVPLIATLVEAKPCGNFCEGNTLVQTTNFFGFCLVIGEDDCSDCSCSCGDYNKGEQLFCIDAKDNDCNGFIDGNDQACLQEATCQEDGLCKPNCITGDPDCLCREQWGYSCSAGQTCDSSIRSKDTNVTCCSTICKEEPTCGFDGRCKINCPDGDPDCSCDQQSGFLCRSGEICDSEIASSERGVCCSNRCEICQENWICTSWSECVNGVQTRNCVDNNFCDTGKNKPAEQRSCADSVSSSSPVNLTCNAVWVCSDWGNCLNGFQTRSCSDVNNCGTNEGKPLTSKSCSLSCAEQDGFECGIGEVCVGEVWSAIDTNECCSLPCEKSECVENWVCPDWEKIPCTQAGIRSRTCVDLNDCRVQGRKTYINIPQLTQECVYIPQCGNSVKDGAESDLDCGGECGNSCLSGQKCNSGSDCNSNECRNGICYCEENWVCEEWNECPAHGVQIRSCTDLNNCGVFNKRPSLTQDCDYTEENETLENIQPKEKVKKEVVADRTQREIETIRLDFKENFNALALPLLIVILIVLVIILKHKAGPGMFISLVAALLVIISLLIYLNLKLPKDHRNVSSLVIILPLIYIMLLSFGYYAHKTKRTFLVVWLNSYPILKKLFFVEAYDFPDIDQIRDYVADSLKRDKNVSEIRQKLIATGWPLSLINKAFSNISIEDKRVSKLSDILVSIMRISSKQENMIITYLLENNNATEKRLMDEFGFSESVLASILTSLENREIIEYRGKKVYLNKSLL